MKKDIFKKKLTKNILSLKLCSIVNRIDTPPLKTINENLKG